MFTQNLKMMVQGSENSEVDVLLMTKTKVQTAAKFKDLNIFKQAATVVTLSKQSTYKNDVINSALKKESNAEQLNEIVEFKPKESLYEHDKEAYYLCSHPEKGTQYIYCKLKSSSASYFLNGEGISIEELVQYLTPSAAKALTEKTEQRNVEHNFVHDVQPLVYKIDSIQSVQIIESGIVIVNENFHV